MRMATESLPDDHSGSTDDRARVDHTGRVSFYSRGVHAELDASFAVR